MQVVEVVAMTEYKEQAKAKHGHDVRCQRQKEEEEVSVVPPADTVVHPWTVVIKVLQSNLKNNAHITHWKSNLNFPSVKSNIIYCVICVCVCAHLNAVVTD